MAASPVGGGYDTPIDRESAYEVLKGRQAEVAPPTPSSHTAPANRGAPRASNRESLSEAAMKSFTRALASSAGRQVMNSIGRELVRGVLGSLMRGR
jgi:hypothetical protein